MSKNETYDMFVDKFVPKLTTDDCYTPEPVYNVVRDYVCRRFGVNPETIVRPFYPGGDYEEFDYKPDSFVLDNPPFSILAQILKFYTERHIRFFLFAPRQGDPALPAVVLMPARRQYHVSQRRTNLHIVCHKRGGF